MRVSRVYGNYGTANYTFVVGETGSLDIEDYEFPDANVGEVYGPHYLSGSGGSGDYEYEVTGGSIPGSLKLNRDGVVSGRPVAVGLYTFTVGVQDRDDVSHATGSATSLPRLR